MLEGRPSINKVRATGEVHLSCELKGIASWTGSVRAGTSKRGKKYSFVENLVAADREASSRALKKHCLMLNNSAQPSPGERASSLFSEWPVSRMLCGLFTVLGHLRVLDTATGSVEQVLKPQAGALDKEQSMWMVWQGEQSNKLADR